MDGVLVRDSSSFERNVMDAKHVRLLDGNACTIAGHLRRQPDACFRQSVHGNVDKLAARFANCDL